MASSNEDVTITHWSEPVAVTEQSIQRKLRAEGLATYGWGNGPGDRYAVHAHSYNKVIYVVSGEITFGLPDQGRSILLVAGDRLFLAQGVRHSAEVGSAGVACLEAHC